MMAYTLARIDTIIEVRHFCCVLCMFKNGFVKLPILYFYSAAYANIFYFVFEEHLQFSSMCL